MDERNPRDAESAGPAPAPQKREVGAVHVMPGAFMTREQKALDKPKKKKPVFLIVAIVFFVIIVSIAFAILLLSRSLRTEEASDVPLEPVNVNGTNEPVNMTNARGNANVANTNSENKNTNGVVNNANDNVNANDNANEDGDRNSNVPSNQNTNVANVNMGPPPPRGPDADRDSLTDAEEEIYGTGINKPDSDSDGFLDGQEVLAGYSPAGPGKLLVSPLVKTFENTLQEYRILYPATWPARGTTNEQTEVLFTSETSEFIQVVTETNPTRMNIFDWYALQYPGVDPDDLPSRTVDGYPAVVASDGMTVTVGVGDLIYTISYNIGIREVANFATTFEMMIQSFDSTRGEGTSPAGNTNVNVNVSANVNANANVNSNTNVNANSNAR